MIDLIYSQDAGQRPDVIITDTGSYSDIAFGLITLLDFDYRPQLADLPDAKLWRIDPTADYGPLNSAARGKIDLGRIRRRWPDILRVVASIHTGAVAAYDILRVLAPGGTPTTRSRTTAGSSRRCTSCSTSTTSPTAATSRPSATSKKAATTSPARCFTARKASCATATARVWKISSERSA